LGNKEEITQCLSENNPAPAESSVDDDAEKKLFLDVNCKVYLTASVENDEAKNISKEDEETYCLCQRSYDHRLYVTCDTCGEWYHPSCLFPEDSFSVRLSQREWSQVHLTCGKNHQSQLVCYHRISLQSVENSADAPNGSVASDEKENNSASKDITICNAKLQRNKSENYNSQTVSNNGDKKLSGFAPLQEQTCAQDMSVAKSTGSSTFLNSDTNVRNENNVSETGTGYAPNQFRVSARLLEECRRAPDGASPCNDDIDINDVVQESWISEETVFPGTL